LQLEKENMPYIAPLPVELKKKDPHSKRTGNYIFLIIKNILVKLQNRIKIKGFCVIRLWKYIQAK
jgi:hypothetical protein